MTNLANEAVARLEEHSEGGGIATAVLAAIASDASPYLIAGLLEGWCTGWRSGSVGRLRRRSDSDMRVVADVRDIAARIRRSADGASEVRRAG